MMKINRKITKTFFATFFAILVCLNIPCWQKGALASTKRLSPETAKVIALKFLSDFNFNNSSLKLNYIGLEDYSGWNATYSPEEYVFRTSGKVQVQLHVNVLTGMVQLFNWFGRNDQLKRLDEQKARQIANDFILRHSTAAQRFGLGVASTRFNDQGAIGKSYSTTWQKYLKGTYYPFWVTVKVSATNGDVISFQWIEHPILISKTVPQITSLRALQFVEAKTRLNKGWTLASQDLQISAVNPKQRLQWVTVLKGFKPSPIYIEGEGRWLNPYQAIGIVDALTGELVSYDEYEDLSRKPLMLEPPSPRPQFYTSFAQWPAWSSTDNGAMLFSHWREMEPDYKRNAIGDSAPGSPGYKGVVSMVDKGQETELLWIPQRLRYPSWSKGNSQRIAFESWYDGIHFLHLKRNWLNALFDGGRGLEREMPSWDSTGDKLVFAGTHSPADKIRTDGQSDIFVVGVAERFNLLVQSEYRCLETLRGRDILPVFSPDNKWVVFANEQRDKTTGGSTWTLYRVNSANDYIDFASKAVAPEKLAVLSQEPERLSWFPDGNRVLVTYPNGENHWTNKPEIINVRTKKRLPFALPILFDPDLPKGKSLIPGEIAVSPSGQKIAFSARRWSGNPKDTAAYCIYICNLNGSGLKRITSPTKARSAAYRYTKPNVTPANAWETMRFKPEEQKFGSTYEQWKRDHTEKPTPTPTPTPQPTPSATAKPRS